MGKLEPTVILLTGLTVFFTVCLFLAEFFFKSDAQFYQTIAGLATGISGALLLKITGLTHVSSKPEQPGPAPVPEPPVTAPTQPAGSQVPQ